MGSIPLIIVSFFKWLVFTIFSKGISNFAIPTFIPKLRRALYYGNLKWATAQCEGMVFQPIVLFVPPCPDDRTAEITWKKEQSEFHFQSVSIFAI